MVGGKDKVTMARAMVIILFSFGTSANWHHHDDDDDNDDFAVFRYNLGKLWWWWWCFHWVLINRQAWGVSRLEQTPWHQTRASMLFDQLSKSNFCFDLSQMKGRMEIKFSSIHEILFCLDLLNLTYFMNRILFDFVIWLGRWREGLEFKMLFVFYFEASVLPVLKIESSMLLPPVF